MNEFEALIHSLGENVFDYLRSARIGMTRLTVESDELTETAHVVIQLEQRTWDVESRAIETLLELREMFLDDISFDYEFIESDEDRTDDATRGVGVPHLVYA